MQYCFCENTDFDFVKKPVPIQYPDLTVAGIANYFENYPLKGM